MKVNWTEQQQDAIDARNASFIVSAAAGSGKTAVLTERLVKLLSDPGSGVRADKIVAVTFTNAAASDLKKKLDKRLREIINDRPGESYLLKQQVLLQSAKISTINAFCFDLLRDHISDQGITSGFGILDKNDEKIIRSQALDELFDSYSREEYEKISYLYDKLCYKDHTLISEAILLADRFISSLAVGERWLDTAVSEYKKEFSDSIYFEALFNDLENKFSYAERLAIDNYNAIPEIFPDLKVKSASKSKIQAEEDLAKVQAMLSLVRNRKFPDREDAAFSSVFPDLVRVRSDVEYNAALRDIYKLRRDRLKKIMTESVPIFAAAPDDYAETAELVGIFAEAVKKFRDLVWQRKCSKNSISFDDGERLVLELLSEYDENGNIVQSETAKRISEEYDIIMIDEYQDSNNKQDLIFKLLSKGFKLNSSGEPMYGRNAFVVGDVKQAIYGFRLANPENFIKVMKDSEPYENGGDSENKSILLNKNFRSSPEVIDFVNYIFGSIMSRNCGDIDYDENEMLHFGASRYTEENSSERLTHITFIDSDISDDESGEGEENGFSGDERPEAEITADKIAEMIKSGVVVTESDGSKRTCTPGDFCILVRTNSYTNYYVDALEKRGIAARGSDERGYLKSQEIAVLTDLLRIIANPLQDVPMASVMVSPMFSFEISELAYIKTFGLKNSLYNIVRAAANGDIPGFDTALGLRCRSFIEAVDAFRLDSVTMTIGELINSIYDTTDFISVMQQYSDGEKKRANLRLLIQYAQNYEISSAAEGGGGLTGFLRHIDRIMENGDYEQGRASSDSGDHVVVQTLHKSKGLEYPFVFISEMSCAFKKDSRSVMCRSDGRIGFILCDSKLIRKYRTFQQRLICDELRKNSLSEEMRLLYVGMTRAKQKLFINLKCGERALKRVGSLIMECIANESDITHMIPNSRCFSDWMWLCLMTHSEFPAIAELLGIDTEITGIPAYDSDEKLFEYEFVSEKAAVEFEAEEKAEVKADDKLTERILREINGEYDRRLSETTAKLSVTQIAKKSRADEEFDFHLQRPRFIRSSGKLTGSERGTAIHTFFQYCSFENAIADTAAEIERLRELGYLTHNQAQCIEAEKICAFFNSPLYGRVKNSIKYEREKKFTVAAGQLDIDDPIFERLRDSDGMIKGIIDLMYEESDGIVIVDYKSDRGAKASELREKYSRQLEIYKAAIELTTGKKVKGLSLYSIELKKEIVIL